MFDKSRGPFITVVYMYTWALMSMNEELDFDKLDGSFLLDKHKTGVWMDTEEE